MTSLQEFIRAEESKMNWLEKLLRAQVEIQSTRALAKLPIRASNETDIKYSLRDKITSCFFILFALFFIAPIISVINLVPLFVVIFALAFIFFMIGGIVWYSLLDPKYIQRLKINNNFIQADNKVIYWKEIDDVFIMPHRNSRNIESYDLVIFKRGSCIEKLDLYKFRFIISKRELANYIEYYRQKSS